MMNISKIQLLNWDKNEYSKGWAAGQLSWAVAFITNPTTCWSLLDISSFHDLPVRNPYMFAMCTSTYKCNFFPQTIRDWNFLPDSLISYAEVSDDCVSKFISLVRARD